MPRPPTVWVWILGATALFSALVHHRIVPELLLVAAGCGLVAEVGVRGLAWVLQRRLRADNLERRSALDGCCAALDRVEASRAHEAEVDRTLAAALVAADRRALAQSLIPGACHDLSNPLCAVIGNVEILGEGDGLPPEVRDTLGTAAVAARQVANLVHELSASVRPDEASDLPTRPSEAVALTLRILGGRLGEGVRVTPRVDRLPWIVGSRARWIHVMQRLIVGADTEERRLQIDGDADAETVRLWIEDVAPDGDDPPPWGWVADDEFVVRFVEEIGGRLDLRGPAVELVVPAARGPSYSL